MAILKLEILEKLAPHLLFTGYFGSFNGISLFYFSIRIWIRIRIRIRIDAKFWQLREKGELFKMLIHSLYFSVSLEATIKARKKLSKVKPVMLTPAVKFDAFCLNTFLFICA